MATTALTPAAATYRSGLYEWLTTTDHKKIGILYLVNSFVFFVLGGILALGVRTELAQPGLQLVTEEAYNQLFTMHASLMLFLFIIPILAGFANYVVPIMIGAPDMAFPRINALSFWMLPLAGILMCSGFLVSGGAAAEGWTSYSPLAQSAYSGTGTDLWIVAVTLIGTSSILGAVNFLVTIFKMRAPGMTMFRLPILVWTALVTSVLVLMATPVLTSALIMLFIDRNYGGSFFDVATGGNAILWQNVFWFYSHPAVYIMVLIAMGIVSEVLPVFSRKPLFGYKAFIFATCAIGALGFSVWAHHMFTTGSVYLPCFSLMTFLIAVPTGVKMFNGSHDVARPADSRRRCSSPGPRCSSAASTERSARRCQSIRPTTRTGVIAHLHYVLFGGSVFSVFAGIYWFPKMSGRMLNETLGNQFVSRSSGSA
jgi:cytochrome c oxidase subunit 1